MNIRRFAISDVAAIADLFTASVHALAGGHYDEAQRAAWAPVPPDLREWEGRLRGLETLVAERGGAVVGFLSYKEDGYIALLYAAPSEARRGVASALYRRVEVELVSSGVGELFTEASLVARPFFERQGFRVKEEQTVSRRGALFRRYLMTKSVGGGPQPGRPET